MKLIGITAIGTYWSPWFPYTLASIYDVCDEIVVANSGFDLDHPPKMKPLEKVHEWIRHLDVNGKVTEIINVHPDQLQHRFPLGTQRAANQRRSQPGGEGNWYDLRGLNLTAANELAAAEGADYILKTDSDEVCYGDVNTFKLAPGTYVFHQVELAGDVSPGHCFLSDSQPVSPYIDTVQTYRGDPLTWYLGAGAIAGPPVDRQQTTLFHCAHLRGANPWFLSQEEKLEHFYGRVLWRLYTNDFGYFSQELRDKAMQDAREALARSAKIPAPVPPPEVCRFQDPLEYIKKGR